MPIDFAHYADRVPAYVKHTFLDRYLPALIARVGHVFGTFVYIDGFAGPWKSAAGEAFSDTSFGIALRHMTAQKQFFAGRGRDVTMKAILVEKVDTTFADLRKAILAYPDVDCVPMQGEFEDHVASICNGIPRNAFAFVLVDPKGFPDVDRILPLLSRRNTEGLVNFMFDFANRFAGTTLIPELERWLSSGGDSSWRSDVEGLRRRGREDRLEELAVAKLRGRAGYPYTPVISVDKPLHDRTLYKLIFLTRHTKGLEVFRDSESAALEAQAASRAEAKANARTSKTGMNDLFSAAQDVPSDRSAIRLSGGEKAAKERLLEILDGSDGNAKTWSDVWPTVLQTTVITRSKLGRIANELRKAGVIDAPGWPSERHRIPPDDQLLLLRR